MTRRKKLTVAGLVAFLLLALYAVVGPLAYQYATAHEVVGIKWSKGIVLKTHGSESYVGGCCTPTVGKLMSSANGDDTHSRICDHNPNGIKDRQVVFNEAGYPLDEINDPNGTDEGCGNKIYENGKAKHQAQGFSGGNYSCHLARGCN